MIRYRSSENLVINIVPSFGQMKQVDENRKLQIMNHIRSLKSMNKVLLKKPDDFDDSRYASFSVRQVVEYPIPETNIRDYLEKSRLSERIGF